MPAMLTSWSRAIFTEGWASIISSTRAWTDSKWGRESVVHQSPQSNPSIYLFKTPHSRTTAAPQIKLLYWTSGVASLHQPIPALTLCPSWTSFCMHLRMHSYKIQTGDSLMTLRRGANKSDGDTWTPLPGTQNLNDIIQIRRQNNTSTMK